MSEEELSSILVTEEKKRNDGPKENYYLDFSQSFDENFEVIMVKTLTRFTLNSNLISSNEVRLSGLPFLKPR
jgi:hypothetical protein